MKKTFKIAVILALVLSLCGCFDYREIEKSYIVSAVGFDKAQDNFIVCLEAANNEKNRVFLASGKDFNAAFKNIGKQFAKEPEFSHTACIVLGDRLDSEAQRAAIAFCGDIKNLSLTAGVIGTRDTASLLGCEPYDETVGFDILKILKKNKLESSLFYEFAVGSEILLPCFEATSEGVVLLENRRRYIG